MYSLHTIVRVTAAFVLLLATLFSSQPRPVSAEVSLQPVLQSEELIGLKLGGTKRCGAVVIWGVQFKGALVYGRRADLTKLLGDVADNASLVMKCTPPCDCELVGRHCLSSLASAEAINGAALPPPPPGTVMVIFDHDGEPPSGNDPNGGDSMIRLYDNAKKDSQCKTELCASSDGEMSVSASCGDVKLKLSSSGKASASIKSGNVTITVP